MTSSRKLLDDCFLHDRDRMRHGDVLAMLADRLAPVVEPQDIALINAVGRICAADISAPHAVPLTDNAAVDGYAFAHADYLANDGAMAVSIRIAAGDPLANALPEGTCARIFTGAPMPKGCDTVAMQEDCAVEEDGFAVTIPPGLKPGANRRKAGEDLAKDAVLVSRGRRLRAQEIAALASIGMRQVSVFAALRVGILSTGNELVGPDVALQPGQVHDSNRPMLHGLLAALPVDVVDLGEAADNEQAIADILTDAAQHCDLVLTTGGASRGEEDHMLNVLDRIGRRHLWQIAVKPGRPMMFGQINDCVVLGLPGNPVAAMVCFLLYVAPVIGHLGGRAVHPPQGYSIPANFEIPKKKRDRREFLRGWIEQGSSNGQQSVAKFPRDGSGLITGLRQATGLIELPEDCGHVAPGELVNFIPFHAFLE